jgi:hypothetical protein
MNTKNVSCKLVLTMACLLAAFCCAIGSLAINARRVWYKADCNVFYQNNHTWAKPNGVTFRYSSQDVYQDMGKTTTVYNSTSPCWIKTRGGKRPPKVSLTEQINPPSQSKEIGFISLWFVLGAIFLGALEALEQNKRCCWAPKTHKVKTKNGMVEMEEEISV